MKRTSRHIATLTAGGSDGWDLYRAARAMVRDGVPVVELTIGEHDRRTEPEILDAMHASAKGGHTGYSTLPGIDALRDAIAARVESRTGVATSRSNVLVTPGGQSGLFSAHVAACDPGDRALFVSPYYATYPGTIRAAGAEAVAVSARAEDGFQPNPEEMRAEAGRAVSLLINSPNNPTGVVYTRETLEGLARLAKETDLWLISDEVYDTQVWSGAHLSPRQLPGMAERTLVIGSLSKSHAMTGSRLGWIVGPENAIADLSNLTTHTTYGLPGFIQDAGVYALSLGPDFEARIAEPFRRRHAMALSILAERGVPVVPSSASMYVMLDIRRTGLTGDAFAHGLLERERIAVMPGESFGEAAAGHLRVALTVPDEALADALRRIADHYHDALRNAA